MHIQIYSENPLIYRALNTLAAEVYASCSRPVTETALHLIDALGSSYQVTMRGIASSMLKGEPFVLLTDREPQTVFPDPAGLYLDARMPVKNIRNLLRHYVVNLSGTVPRPLLSPKERITAALLSRGLGISEIAEAMCVSEKTVYARLGNVRRKMQLPSLLALRYTLHHGTFPA